MVPKSNLPVPPNPHCPDQAAVYIAALLLLILGPIQVRACMLLCTQSKSVLPSPFKLQ